MSHVTLTIDGREVIAHAGMTVLEAARAAGVDIPTLCYREDIEPRTSCFVCIVEVEGAGAFVPSCAARVTEGIVVRTQSPAIVAARKTALELLFSDHAGGCVAPCVMTCPAHIDIPGFIRELLAGRPRNAVAIIKRSIPFPSVLGRVCPAACESPCVRKRVEAPIAIRLLHRFAGDADLASGNPYLPECRPSSGKRVAVVGAGPAGLTAAYYALQAGHACELFDAAGRPGGLMRHIPDDALDKATLDAEIAVIERLGAAFHGGWRLGRDASLDELRREFDAVVLAVGASRVAAPQASHGERAVDLEFAKSHGLEVTKKGVAADAHSHATNLPCVFAAGEVVSGKSSVVKAVADGHAAAIAIDQYLRGQEASAAPAGAARPLYFWRNATDAEFAALHGARAKTPRAESGPAGLSASAVASESRRCLQCSCAKENDCRLRAYGAQYGVNSNRFRGERRTLAPDESHAEIVYEPGKCVLCGLCLKIAEAGGEERGLCFVGRGFPARMAVPLNGELSEGLRRVARQCAEACPTAALAIRGS